MFVVITVILKLQRLLMVLIRYEDHEQVLEIKLVHNKKPLNPYGETEVFNSFFTA